MLHPARFHPMGARQDDPAPSQVERNAHDLVDMAFERIADLLPSLGVPEPQRAVASAGDDAAPIRAERRGRRSSMDFCRFQGPVRV